MGPTTTGHVERLAANLLRVARAKAGISQREVADAVHVAQSTIARIESGTRQPSLPVLARILAAIDLEMRITLEVYGTLDAEDKRLSADQRAVRRATQDQFAAQLQEKESCLPDVSFDWIETRGGPVETASASRRSG